MSIVLVQTSITRGHMVQRYLFACALDDCLGSLSVDPSGVRSAKQDVSSHAKANGWRRRSIGWVCSKHDEAAIARATLDQKLRQPGRPVIPEHVMASLQRHIDAEIAKSSGGGADVVSE